jgi:DNA-binding MarR family transcriptional regulator
VNDGQELARALRAAYWAMHRRTNEALATYGVTADQFVLLSRLADEDAITQQELARRTSSDANTIRPMLVLLEKRGLIVRRPHPSDRRAHRVVLTAAGRRQFAGMMRATSRCRRTMLSGVKLGSPGALWRDLHQIAAVLESPVRRAANARQRA